MRADTATDHGDLALLAQNHAAELRPLLLRVQVQNFADAPHRDPGTVAHFETIALGLIPLVSDDVLADAARVLRGVPETPRPVLCALLERLQSTPDESPSGEPLEPVVSGTPCPIEIARDLDRPLHDDTTTDLIGHAASDRALAEALLARPDMTVFDRSTLYAHANEEQRAAIREDLADALASIHLPRLVAGGEAAREVMAVASRRNLDATRTVVATRLGVEPDTFLFGEPAGQELFLFALVAIGLDHSECVRVLLMLETPGSRSVPTMFRLAELARMTPRPVAAFLVGHERLTRSARTNDPAPPARGLASLRGSARVETIPGHPRAGRDREPNARADRRS